MAKLKLTAAERACVARKIGTVYDELIAEGKGKAAARAQAFAIAASMCRKNAAAKLAEIEESLDDEDRAEIEKGLDEALEARELRAAVALHLAPDCPACGGEKK